MGCRRENGGKGEKGMGKNLYGETGKNEGIVWYREKNGKEGLFVCLVRKGPPDVARPTNEKEG